jgi:signal peptidase II
MDDASPSTTNEPVPAPTRPRRHLVALLVTLWGLVLVLDQLTKTLALQRLADNVPVPVLGDLLRLRLVFNPGAAFSMGTGMTWVFTLIALGVVIVVARVARRLGSIGWAVAFGLLLGGATGNLVDRLARAPGFGRGHVVDFIELPNFPVFNVADSAITCAAVLIILLGLRGIGVDGAREPGRERARG